MGGTGEFRPFLAAALAQRSTSPFAQAGRRKRGQQIAHIPIVIVTPGLLESVDICKRHQRLILIPMQAMNSTCNIFRHSNIGSTKRSAGLDEYAVNIEEDGIKARGEVQVWSFPGYRDLHYEGLSFIRF